jgi:hypothetical protein
MKALTPAEGTVGKEEGLKRGLRKGEESAIGEFQLNPRQQKNRSRKEKKGQNMQF